MGALRVPLVGARVRVGLVHGREEGILQLHQKGVRRRVGVVVELRDLNTHRDETQLLRLGRHHEQLGLGDRLLATACIVPVDPVRGSGQQLVQRRRVAPLARGRRRVLGPHVQLVHHAVERVGRVDLIRSLGRRLHLQSRRHPHVRARLVPQVDVRCDPMRKHLSRRRERPLGLLQLGGQRRRAPARRLRGHHVDKVLGDLFGREELVCGQVLLPKVHHDVLSERPHGEAELFGEHRRAPLARGRVQRAVLGGAARAAHGSARR